MPVLPVSSRTAGDTALAQPGDSHERPFTEQLDLYKAAGKVFLIVTNDPDERIVTLKAEPKYGRLLQHEHPSIPPGLPTKPSLPSTWRSSQREGGAPWPPRFPRQIS
ncbi:hypothetical protein [Streptomyces sp. NPDC004589]|uniref:MmcQ/YjbR family DNA-binding protein n=1 Tax=Streptomyces sp. NPDC004589 TaxID=3154553 RepID=UPI0033AE8B9E